MKRRTIISLLLVLAMLMGCSPRRRWLREALCMRRKR